MADDVTQDDLPVFESTEEEIYSAFLDDPDPDVFAQKLARIALREATEFAIEHGIECADRLFEELEHTASPESRRDILRREFVVRERVLRQGLALHAITLARSGDKATAQIVRNESIGVGAR